jgi:ABC-type Mn2+/Zn2+ transport system ATPase subunit
LEYLNISLLSFFRWGKDEPVVLSNVNIRIKEGSLTAVVGAVGAGKSSLVSAMLGELERENGRVNTRGSVAYVPQQAWMQGRDSQIFNNYS